jgi:adenylate cyclase
VYLTPIPGLYYYEALLVLFAVLGIVHYVLRRQHFAWSWLSYVSIGLDFALLTFTLFAPNPVAVEQRPPQMALRHDPIVYYCLWIAAVAFSYSPSLMLWTGIAAAVSWSVGVLWLLSLPDTRTKVDHPLEMTEVQHIAEDLEARFVDTDVCIQNLVLLLLVAGVLAFMVQRSRRLVVRQARAARQRANLSRYFSLNVLDEVAGADGPLTAVRKHEVAVLFTDIVGFTRLCETVAPEDAMELLREYHTRLEEQVFRYSGTPDKFIGDAVMASFGAPRSGLQDATSALRCARAMLRSLAHGNALNIPLPETVVNITPLQYIHKLGVCCPYATPGLETELEHPRIKHIANPVTSQVNGQYGEQNSQAREGGDPPGNVDIVPSQGSHLTPGGIGEAGAQAQEAQSRLGQNGLGSLQGGHDND